MKTKPIIKSISIFFLVLFVSTSVLGIQDLFHNHSDHHDEHFGLYGQIHHDCDHKSDNHKSPENNEDQKEDCQLCDKILIDSFSQYFGSDESADIEELPEHFHKNIVDQYTSETYTIGLSTTLFSRPPPTFI